LPTRHGCDPQLLAKPFSRHLPPFSTVCLAGTSPKPPANQSLGNSAVIFTDSSVQAGQTYFYTVTAVDSVGTESARSNEVQATVPTP